MNSSSEIPLGLRYKSNTGDPLSSVSSDELVDEHNNTLVDTQEPIAVYGEKLQHIQLTSKELLFKVLKKEAISRHGFRGSMTIATASLALLAIPAVGWILCPVVAGIALLSAGAFFAYRHVVIAPRLIDLDETDVVRDAELEGVEIPTKIISKLEFIDGLYCLILVGAIKFYVQPFFKRMLEKDIMITVNL